MPPVVLEAQRGQRGARHLLHGQRPEDPQPLLGLGATVSLAAALGLAALLAAAHQLAEEEALRLLDRLVQLLRQVVPLLPHRLFRQALDLVAAAAWV